MKKFFEKLFTKPRQEDFSGLEEEYVELDSNASKDEATKVVVRPFVLEDFSDVKDIIDGLRTGNTIALVNIKPLKEKDIIELKRAINKLKKTTDAIKGQIKGFSEDYIIVAPEFAEIYQAPVAQELDE
jgi:SepF-like predicted cell division protein (DUF552 family)